MSNFFYSPFAIPIVAILGTFIWLILSALAKAAYAIVRHRNETELKQAMVARGFNAEEIERVLVANTKQEEAQE